MARYIDADKLKERLEIISVVADDLYGMGINRGIDRAETEIDMLPTADVVEVVRCSECKHFAINQVGMFCEKYTSIHDACRNPDDFCSYGERRDT